MPRIAKTPHKESNLKAATFYPGNNQVSRIEVFSNINDVNKLFFKNTPETSKNQDSQNSPKNTTPKTSPRATPILLTSLEPDTSKSNSSSSPGDKIVQLLQNLAKPDLTGQNTTVSPGPSGTGSTRLSQPLFCLITSWLFNAAVLFGIVEQALGPMRLY